MLISLFIVLIGVLIILSFLSIMASTIMDWVSGSFHFKGRNLERALRNMLASTDVNETVYNQFKENPLYRQLSKYPNRKGSRPSYMNKETFQSILINTITNSKNVHDPEKVKEYIELLPDVDLKNTLRQLMADADNDMTQFRRNVEIWYEDVMERSRGWYARMTKRGLLIIGVSMAFLFNVDAIQVFNSLQSNPEQMQRIFSAAQYIQSNPDGGLGISPGITSLLSTPTTPYPAQPYNPPPVNTMPLNPNAGNIQAFTPPADPVATQGQVQPFTPPGQESGSIQAFTPPAETGGPGQVQPFTPPGQEAGAPPQAFDPTPMAAQQTPAFGAPSGSNLTNYLLQDKEISELVDSASVLQVKNALKRSVESATSPLGIGWNLDMVKTMDMKAWAVKVLGWLITGFSISFGAPVLFDVLKKLKAANIA